MTIMLARNLVGGFFTDVCFEVSIVCEIGRCCRVGYHVPWRSLWMHVTFMSAFSSLLDYNIFFSEWMGFCLCFKKMKSWLFFSLAWNQMFRFVLGVSSIIGSRY
jgi:hypothetical protein